MSYSKRSRYSPSPSPLKRYGRSVSRSSSRSRLRSMSRSRSRSYDTSDVENPGNNLYVTGLSTRMTKRDLEKHFATEGTVDDVHLVVDPWTRESRGFGFVTMSNLDEANRCVKYLNRSVLDGRVITVEKARRRRGRTPTPGRYLGLRTISARRQTPSYSPYSRSRSPCYSLERGRSRSRSFSRSYSPYHRRRRLRRSTSSYSRRRRSYSRSCSPYSRSPVGRRDRSHSPYYYRRNYSPYGRRHCRGISRSTSPRVRRHSRGNYSPSLSARSSRSYSRSRSPIRFGASSYSPSVSPSRRRRTSRRATHEAFHRDPEEARGRVFRL